MRILQATVFANWSDNLDRIEGREGINLVRTYYNANVKAAVNVNDKLDFADSKWGLTPQNS